jgi:Sec-independent protein translocase protein TatA
MKADRIPGLVASLGKVITDIRKEQSERNKSSINENVHYHFYCPEPKKLEQYEVIEVG